MIEVARLAELEEGKPKVLEVRGKEIVIIRWGEDVHALRNVCPHQTQSFACGRVHARLAATGARESLTVTDEPVIACPWHKWEFSLRTGQCLVDSTLRVRTYSTKVDSGRIFVDVK